MQYPAIMKTRRVGETLQDRATKQKVNNKNQTIEHQRNYDEQRQYQGRNPGKAQHKAGSERQREPEGELSQRSRKQRLRRVENSNKHTTGNKIAKQM